MKNEALFRAIGGISDAYVAEAMPVGEASVETETGRGGRKYVRIALILAAAIALLGLTTVAAAGRSFDLLNWITGAFTELNPAVVERELADGEWVYLNGDNIAVILPESPVKIMLSDDGGSTWSESTVTGSEEMTFLGERRDEMQYWGGYIGLNGEENGYLVLTSDVAMNHQALRIYLTGDGGKTWTEIGNPYEQHISVLTGAGFASERVGFISYRYFEDVGPDIWWTQDGGETWSRLEVELPEEYQGEQYRFTPQSPAFEGTEGIYPIVVIDNRSEEETTICMYSDDGGMTWNFR